MAKRRLASEPKFVKWAEQAVKGLDDSATMLAVWNGDRLGKGPRFEFELQIGHCLCEGKPIVIVCEDGTAIPPKLAQVAAAVEYYAPGHEAGMMAAVKRALAKVGVERPH
jgi:hypothetical protein